MNAAGDIRGLVHALRQLLPQPDRISTFTLNECLAAMRDLGLVLGSIKRHGQQPVHAVPEVEPILLELGRRTDMIPRDTVHHYTEWNPTGERQRMFTGDPQEGFLMNGARGSLPPLADAIEICTRLSVIDLGKPEFVMLLTELDEALGAFNRAISMVTGTVSPEFFARQMRPYYEEITVGGQAYLGPAAAHVPLFLIDLTLWASDRGDQAYMAFISEAAQHTLPQWRAHVPAWSRMPSLVTRVIDACTTHLASETTAAEAAVLAVATILRTLMLFRGKHLAIARKSYRDDVRLYELGSGGGNIALLHRILDLTRENAALVRRPAQPRDGMRAQEAAHGQTPG